jgi:hypothetical protein
MNPFDVVVNCIESIQITVGAWNQGERNPAILALDYVGVTNTMRKEGEALAALNNDAAVSFSNAPLSERLPHAIMLGGVATITAALMVGIPGGATGPEVSEVNTSSGYGGDFLKPDDKIAIFASQKGAASFKTFDALGNSAQSLGVAGSPEQAFSSAFSRSPQPGEPYWTTTTGQIGATGRFPYLDAEGSAGHVSIYGGEFLDEGEFTKIWEPHIFGEQ